jgi:hypothetical protein
MIKLVYKPFGMIVGVFGGILAGAIFALVKAAVDRGAAEGVRKLTGVWPGDGGSSPKEA